MQNTTIQGVRWIEAGTYEEMSKLAADRIEQQLKRKSDSVLGLATGNSPLGVYKELAERVAAGTLSFKEAKSFNLDEYVGLGSEDKTSYHHYMQKELFSKIDMQPGNGHVPNGLAADLAEECAAYERAIEQSGGIDFQLLGIGVNGHIGFNEPGTSFESVTHVETLTESTRQKNAEHFPTGEVPEEAITMGLGSIMKAKEIVMLVFGEEKAEAVERLQSGVVSEDFPASVLHNHENVTIIWGK